MKREQIDIYIDESGEIHSHSSKNFFSIGGYFVNNNYNSVSIAKYRKLNKKMIKSRQGKFGSEIKSFDMIDKEKINIFRTMENIPTLLGFTKIFDKKRMHTKINDENIFYNYAIKIITQDFIIPNLANFNANTPYFFYYHCDMRSIKVKNLNQLAEYLKTEFSIYNINFKVTYYNSQDNFGVQFADLIANTFYNKYQHPNIVKDILPYLNHEKYLHSTFPKIKEET